MKNRIILLAISIMLAVTLQAQTYDQLWKRVEQMEKKDLPESVIAEAEKIYAKAKEERNVPQMMKAYLTMMACRKNISPDSLAVDIKGLEEWAASPQTELSDKAVLYSILGGEIDDFDQKNEYLHLSLKDSLKLVDYPAEKLVPMVTTGETSRLYFENNLYDLLARRAIRLWEENQWNLQQEDTRKSIQETYQSLLHIYKVKNMRSAWLLTALDAYPQADETQLRAWIKEYADVDVCAEVYLRLAESMWEEPAERLALLREGIKRYGNYNRINALKNEEQRILAPSLDFQANYAYPGEPIRLRVQHRNLLGFTMKYYRLSLSAESTSLDEVNPKTVVKYGKLVGKEHFNLPPTPDYRLRTDTVEINPLEAGIYYVVSIPDGHRNTVQGALVYVSALQVLHRALPNDRQEIVVLDKQSGHPVANAQVDIYQIVERGYDLKESHTANAEGVVTILMKGTSSYYCQARTLKDTFMPLKYIWLGRKNYQVSDKTQEYVNLFTDRSLYRPGQTLHFSGIAYSQRKDVTKAKAGNTYTVRLLDADRQEIAKQEVKADEFGTFQGTFDLPESGEMGIYRLQTDKGSTTFRVEEYKRPTFEVEFDEVKTVYRSGDSIRVTGIARTFAGAPVQEAKVNYQVVRHEISPWRMRGMATRRVSGETITDAEGRFEVPVHFLPVPEGEKYWFYSYEVSADVTNVAGETQMGTLNLPLGSSSLRLDIPNWEGITLIKEEPKDLTFQVVNLTNVPIETEVDYQIWSVNKQVWQGKAVSNKPFVPESIYALPSGNYQLKAIVTDEAGKKNEQTINFVLLSLKDKHLPEGVENWCYQSSDEFAADGTATIYFGSKEKDVYLFYDVMWGNNQMERKRITFSDSILAFRYTYKEEYGDGLQCSFAYLKNGELYVKSLYIKKPEPEKSLQLKWKTFRDKFQPGQQETWTLSILRPDGKPADAQLLATMYDASLDQLAPHAWRFGLNFTRSFPNDIWQYGGNRHSYWNFSFSWKRLTYQPLEYSQLEAPVKIGFVEVVGTAIPPHARPMMMKAAVNQSAELNYVVEESALGDLALEEKDNVQLRTNLAETAFFYPQLHTDSNGEVNIEFTLPESLTEWKFMGLAHTKEMDYGSIEAQVVASKDFMLQPNLPRFVRVGDEVSVSASLMNLSDKEVNGVVRMELFEPETEKIVLNRKRPFAVKAGETGKVTFSFDVTDKYEGLAIRMVADGDWFSDGEQRYLPVLSNKQRMTESVLLDVNGKGTYTFPLESLFNGHSKTVSRPKMMVEFTGNPLWYAIQALKAVRNPDNDNVLSWVTAYYANSLLLHLARTKPEIADSLQTEGLDASLKEAVLKMKGLQASDGSWSWYKGMLGSPYMTTAVTQLLARLHRMTGDLSDEVKPMYRKAFAFLSSEVSEEVKRMREAERKGIKDVEPSERALQYLYISSLDKDLPVAADVNKYLISKLETLSGRFTIYGKALGAIVLQASGKSEKAKEFLESLMQYSVMTEPMGRYFDTPKAFYSWFSYKIPTQVMAIEAVHFVAHEEKTQEELKRWLLKQKQVQVWDTPIATTDAVYALLTTGTDWLANTSEGEIRIGKDDIKFGEGKNLGYIQREVTGKVTDIRKVTVVKASTGIGWGAVYAEFEEEMDKVSAQGNALQVSRILLKDGKPLAEGELLNVGDKLDVCLVVKADRDMDFVQVKDERAACLEPVDVLSDYRWTDGIGYYQETKDASTSFFLERLRKGTYSLEYEVYVSSAGRYTQGVPTVRSVYAPEFGGHATGGSLFVK